MNKLPLARTEDLVIKELGQEILVYDLTTDKYFCLNETSALVYQACDSNSTFEELKRKHRFTDDLICLTLDELKANDLLERNTDYKSTLANLSRREAIRKVGLASMIALPIITGLVAPKAIDAQSGICQVGTCIRRDLSICPAGCNGKHLTYDVYNSSDGTRTGGVVGQSMADCPTALTGQYDFKITSVT